MDADTAARRLLRFITCGSVDDGKSTLIGRLLHDCQLIMDDTLTALERDSLKHGTTGEDTDLALLVDGLESEREQGITIDVAYRFFTTPARAFIVADTPGHEQYTRNMATGASTAEAAVILVDARKGLLTQTRRHSFICSLLGIRHVVLAVNKMDLVGFDQAAFRAIVDQYRAFAGSLGFATVTAIPLSALTGDNVARPSTVMGWHDGGTLLAHLEQLDTETDAARLAFRFPVQYVNRPDQNFRGFSGSVASGRIAVGDGVTALPSGRETRIARILGPDADQPEAVATEAVTLVLADEIDVARGDMLAATSARPEVADQFAAHLVWMAEAPMLPGRRYMMRINTMLVPASVSAIKHRIDVNTLEQMPGTKLGLNEIGFCNLQTDRPVALDPYAENRHTGRFVLIDRETCQTVAAGMVAFPLRRASNIHRESYVIDRPAREARLGQRARLVWLTGLSGSGKSAIARALAARLHEAGRLAYVLDGDNLRHGLNRDLGFTEADRVENIRRAGEVGALLVDAGLIVIAAFISPYRAERDAIREGLPAGDFVEVFVDTPLEECERRDVKGLYARARAGKIPNFTGIDSPYEAPMSPELHLSTAGRDVALLVSEIMERLNA
jgi:bifunctional enzyme CysN/CysC